MPCRNVGRLPQRGGVVQAAAICCDIVAATDADAAAIATSNDAIYCSLLRILILSECSS